MVASEVTWRCLAADLRLEMSRSLLQRISNAALVAAAAMAQRRHVAVANSTAFKAAAVMRQRRGGHDEPEMKIFCTEF
jgi:hypothetical protein